MTTIMRAVNPGSYDRRCDAKCHYATGPVCDCLCAGRYHGAGLEKEGHLEKLVEDTLEEVFEQAKLRFPEVQLGGEEDQEEAEELLPQPKKMRSLWEIPTKRPKKW